MLYNNYYYLILSAISIQLFSILDLVDGNIARIKSLQSKFGMWLDIFDKIVDFLIILSASLGIFITNNDPVILIWGIILMGTVFLIKLL